MSATLLLRWLPALLAGEDHIAKTGALPDGTRWAVLDEGVLLLEPADESAAQIDLLLSCGIHGNETAPIEMLDRLLQQLASGVVSNPAARVLLIFGNPAAIRAGERYLDDDLNRLFGGKHRFYQDSREARRAALLEQYAQRFFEMGQGQRLHLDLHTAIRASYYPKFAICPAQGNTPYIDSLLGLLQAVDVGTLLLQPQPSNTFSCYTVSQFGARALTLELGQARPFGNNQSLPLDEWLALLQRLLQGQLPPASAPLDIHRFAVTREVIRTSEQFVLHLADDVANFTPLPAGYLLAEDGAQQTIVAAGEHILFPNPAVKVGLRAGILVARIDA